MNALLHEIEASRQTAIATIAWEPLDGQPPDVPERMNVANLSKVTQRGIMDD